MLKDNRILNIVVGIFAVIGLVTVLGVAGIAAAHVHMMSGAQGCGQAMHFWQHNQAGGPGDAQ
ncbi:hypothetical protein J4763_07045 [Burkholderia pseudomallei]|uniref:hypothetical protein n=1 Tax=Burkholderia pseudomallei TaxID=28450 RepID=UPI001AAF7D6C|nr:hypothetical protein [Burkholderia pseudomallei]MBO3056545.1 hypothetical protein [Burkholderia pseudomallei]